MFDEKMIKKIIHEEIISKDRRHYKQAKYAFLVVSYGERSPSLRFFFHGL